MIDESVQHEVPVKIVELELSQRLEPVDLEFADGGRSYARAVCLVRLHDRPLGLVWLPLEASVREGCTLGTKWIASQIWAALGARIRHHLAADGLPEPGCVPVGGLPMPSTSPCVAARHAVRAGAPLASIVVATRERPSALERCLDSLLELDYSEYEIIVVDNAPATSATREVLANDRFCRVRYVRESRPGLGAAHNRGLAEASGTFVAFTDDDVIVDRLWLLELARGFRLAERVACVTGLIVPARLDTPAQLAAERLWGFNKGFSEQVFDRDTARGDALYPYTAGTFGSGANMAFDTTILRRLGGFDPATGAGTIACGGDDLSAFFTVVSAGYRLAYNPAALVRHEHHAEYSALERQAYGYGVGLTAFLTKAIIDRPERLLQIARLSRHGVVRVLDPRAGAIRRSSLPHEPRPPTGLVRAERRGMLYGPAAYLRSRRRVRRDGQR
jgi:GT2 family glycosyltransferase